MARGCPVARRRRRARAETLDNTAAANLFAGPLSLEFSANYSGDQFQHAGLGQLFASTSEPWAIFSTLSGGMLFARTNTGNGAIDTPIGVAPLGEFHRYRIDWTPTSVTYYVDGALVATHNVAVPGPMRPVAASDFNPFGGIIFVDWMRLMPSTSPGEFESRVFDANALVDWKAIQWQANVPAGTSLQISVRTGNTAVPDGSWSAWMPVAGPGALSLNSQFIQYRADMSSTLPNVSPELQDVIITTGNAPSAVDDSAVGATERHLHVRVVGSGQPDLQRQRSGFRRHLACRLGHRTGPRRGHRERRWLGHLRAGPELQRARRVRLHRQRRSAHVERDGHS